MNLYIVVEVTHDYYRFQKNLYASFSLLDCKKYVKENGNDAWPAIMYEDGGIVMKDLDSKEKEHYWFQKLKMEN